MEQRSLDLASVSRAFKALAARAGWQAYHTPKNLAVAAAVEVGELLEIFQWMNDEQIEALAQDVNMKEKVADEVADVMMYLVELCNRMEIDMADAVKQKIEKNERRLNV